MKKFLTMLLVIIMMVSMFAGCNNEPEKEENSNSESETENGGIVVEPLNKSFTAIIYGDDEDKEYWNGLKASFETQNQGVTINMIITKDAAYEVRDRILAGNSPDFVFLPSDEESGVTEALIKDKAMTELGEIKFAPAGAFDNSKCKPYDDGKIYLAPISFEQKGLIYNKELLSDNGFSVPATWDDFVDIAEDCKNKKFSFYTYSGSEPEEFADIFAAAILGSVGTEEMNRILDYDKEAWKNDAITKFAEKIESIKSLVVNGSSTKDREDVIECLKDGEALFISGTESDLEELNKDGDKYAICSYPSLDGNSTAIMTFSEMYIPIEAKEPELAKQFMEHIYMTEAASSQYTSVYCPEFKTKNADNETLSDEFCKLVVEIFKGKVSADEFSDEMLEYIEEY